MADNTIQDNVAGTKGMSFGGGIAVSSLVTRPTLLTLTNNSILNNTAGLNGLLARGGGIYLYYSDNVTTTLLDNLISRNIGNQGGVGYGGGLYSEDGYTVLQGNIVEANIASTADWGTGGGLRIGGMTTLTQNHVRGNFATTSSKNSASPSVYTEGGGLYLSASQADIENNIFTNNRAGTEQAGYCGAAFLYGDDVTFSGNAVQGNIASTAGEGKGGGLCLDGGAVMTRNVIEGNSASTAGAGSGGGVYIGSPSSGGGEGAETLSENTIQGNVASTIGQGNGGGIYLSRGGMNETITITHNLVQDNKGSLGAGGAGGGLYLATTGWDAVVDANTVLRNQAATSASANGLGGGMYVTKNAEFTLINNVIAANQANTQGSGIWIRDGGPGLFQTTLADNSGSIGLWVELSGYSLLSSNYVSGINLIVGGTLSEGIGETVVISHTDGVTAEARQIVNLQADYVNQITTLTLDTALTHTYPAGSRIIIAPLKLTNTIIAGHTNTGVSGNGPFIMQNTLWHANSVDRSGVIVTSQDLTGDPAFKDSANGDYHITQPSAAVDHGVEAGVPTDLDTQLRPNPSTNIPDLGADEYYAGCMAITTVSISGPDSGVVNRDMIFTALITPSGATPNILYTWSPEPEVGQGTDLAAYRFDTSDEYDINLLVQNCGGSLNALHTITINQNPGFKVFLPIVSR